MARRERIPTGGALATFDPLLAGMGYIQDPRAAFNAYGSRQITNLGGTLQPRLANVYGGARQGFNLPVSQGVNQASRAFRYGSMAAKGLPYLPAVGNVLEGDLAGAGLSAGGALAGGAIGGILLPGVGAPIGATIGGMLGEPVGKGVVKLAGGLMGIDPNNPLSGPDISIFGKPLSPYAKTKKQQERAIKLAELRMPLYNKIMDKQLAREMQMQQANNISESIRNVYSTNPYIR